ncbi:endoplasmic reticulum lectin 1 [Clonorchis sinensis]|uniref:Endoplasmic reticulum lectin 1 n=1 Tax=Clonorchis sinensis TaxID=79923 RepID=G7Y8R2_CLOSI|nr:endoplasmic reticulum lectin 1 [Clonorchis sinensis]
MGPWSKTLRRMPGLAECRFVRPLTNSPGFQFVYERIYRRDKLILGLRCFSQERRIYKYLGVVRFTDARIPTGRTRLAPDGRTNYTATHLLRMIEAIDKGSLGPPEDTEVGDRYHTDLSPDVTPDELNSAAIGLLLACMPIASRGNIRSRPRPGILLGGSSYPYYVVKYVDGTPCDLTGERRVTSVLYICLEDEDGRIIQVSEVESCQYQVVFATRYLCSHPAYRLPKRPVKPLSCAPREGAIAKPASLLEFEKQQEQLSQHGISNLAALFGNVALKNIRVEANRRNNLIVYRIRTIDADESNETNEETMSQEDTSSSDEDSANRGDTGKVATPSGLSSKPTVPGNAYRTRFLEFLSGKFCLQGRTSGWWQYEICLRSNVTQYHVVSISYEIDIPVRYIWLTTKGNVRKRFYWVSGTKVRMKDGQQNRLEIRFHIGVNLFYGNGEFCELIKQARETIVKLKCNAAANGIHLSFSERTECRYTVLKGRARYIMPDDERLWQNRGILAFVVHSGVKTFHRDVTYLLHMPLNPWKPSELIELRCRSPRERLQNNIMSEGRRKFGVL